MLKSYSEIIQNLFSNVFQGGHEQITFVQYLQAIGMSLAIIALVVAICALVFGLIIAPKKVLSTMYAYFDKPLRAAYEKEQTVEVFELVDKLTKITAVKKSTFHNRIFSSLYCCRIPYDSVRNRLV